MLMEKESLYKGLKPIPIDTTCTVVNVGYSPELKRWFAELKGANKVRFRRVVLHGPTANECEFRCLNWDFNRVIILDGFLDRGRFDRALDGDYSGIPIIRIEPSNQRILYHASPGMIICLPD